MAYKSIILIIAAAASASAATIVVDTTDRGYYYSYDFSDITNKNYLTGQLNTGTVTGFHSFYSFAAFSGLTGPIVSATLSLFNPNGGYSSGQSSESLTIDGFSGDVATLDGGGTVSGEYNALAAGTVFAGQTVSAASDGTFINITLNAAAIAFLNANSSSPFAFGGYLAGIPPSDTSSRFVFGGSAFTVSNDGNTQLTIVTGPATAPEPGTWLFSMLGVAALLIRRAGKQ
jgi:hypothetical protein